MGKLTAESTRKMSVYDRSEDAAARDAIGALDRLEIQSARRGARYVGSIFYVSTFMGFYEMTRAVLEKDVALGLISLPLIASGIAGVAMFRNIDKRYKKQLEDIS